MDNDQRDLRIESKLDKVVDDIGVINNTLSAQHETLKEHIQRTELLEAAVKPLVKHDNMLQGVIKLIGILALGGGIIEGLMALLTYVRGH